MNLHRDCLSNRSRAEICIDDSDANAAYAYYAGHYRKSLSIIIGGSYTADVPAFGLAAAELDAALKDRANKLSREMYDTAMRTCVQLKDSGWAGYLADVSQKYVSHWSCACMLAGRTIRLTRHSL